MSRLLITGAAGQVGTALMRLRPDAIGIDLPELDLTDARAVTSFLEESGPSAIVNAAAYTAVDRAEEQEELATAVNGEAVGTLAAFADRAGIPFITYSTDYVFPGNASTPYLESSPTDPINAYGRSKLVGEQAAGRFPSSLIIRTSWVVSGTHPNFVATMLRLAAERELQVVDDQTGCPTVAADLAAATLQALEAGVSGVLHLTNRGATTWYRLARAAVTLAGLDPDRITPCTTTDYPTPSARPAYSVLGSERLAVLGMDPLPVWEDSLPTLVAELMEGS